MIKFIFFLSSILLSITIIAQTDIQSYVKEKTHPIATVQPDSGSYTDFKVIGNAIGDARIVMLGEQDHGDAPTFLAKTRLIKYLHEQKGFNVVAFENDFFTSIDGWDKLPKTTNEIDSFLKKSIIPYWPYCDACQYLFFNLIPASHQTKNPLQVAGIDNQQFIKYSSKNLARELDSVLKNQQLAITKKENYTTDIIPLIDSLTRLSIMQKGDEFFTTAIDYLTTIKDQLTIKLGKDNFWTLVTDNLIATAKEYQYIKASPFKGGNERDLQMAKNLDWLSNVKYPNEKIIVWAQNWHISKYSGNYPQKYMNEGSSMATEFIKDPQNNKQTFCIGFTSYAGTAGRIMSKPFTVDKPQKNSIESWIDESYNYAFIDFTAYNQQYANTATEFMMKASTEGLHKNQLAQWTKNFDAVFYIKNMVPCVFVR